METLKGLSDVQTICVAVMFIALVAGIAYILRNTY